MDDIEGHRPEASDLVNQLMDEHEQEKKTRRQQMDHVKEQILNKLEDDSDEEGKKNETELLEIEQPREKWDCESILSTYSNLYHHPKLISEPSKKKVN